MCNYNLYSINCTNEMNPFQYRPVLQREKLVYNGGASNFQPLLFVNSRMDVAQICMALVTKYVLPRYQHFSHLDYSLLFWNAAIIHHQLVATLRSHLWNTAIIHHQLVATLRSHLWNTATMHHQLVATLRNHLRFIYRIYQTMCNY